MQKLSSNYSHSQEGVLGTSMKFVVTFMKLIKPKLTSLKNLKKVTPSIIKSIIENDGFNQVRGWEDGVNSVSLNHSIMINF